MYVKVSFQPHTVHFGWKLLCEFTKEAAGGIDQYISRRNFFTNFKFNQENHIFKLFIQAKVQAHQLNGSI